MNEKTSENIEQLSKSNNESTLSTSKIIMKSAETNLAREKELLKSLSEKEKFKLMVEDIVKNYCYD